MGWTEQRAEEVAQDLKLEWQRMSAAKDDAPPSSK
jgi:hypothetical protein